MSCQPKELAETHGGEFWAIQCKYPPERVQLMAQGLLLRRHGFGNTWRTADVSQHIRAHGSVLAALKQDAPRLGRMFQLFGDGMGELIEEINGELAA